MVILFAAIDDCASNPCNNGGTCTDLKDDISCACPAGYSDKYCEKEDDECLSDPCYQGATCVDKVRIPKDSMHIPCILLLF